MRKHASRETSSTSIELMLISNPLNLLQVLKTILICNVVLCFPHDNIACIHMCNERKGSKVRNVCHMLWFISSLHEQVCSQNLKHQVYQYVLNADMSEQVVNKLWTILQLIHFLRLQIDDHRCMALRLCKIAHLFCSQVRNIFRSICSHDLPCFMTMKILLRHQVHRCFCFWRFSQSSSRNPLFVNILL